MAKVQVLMGPIDGIQLIRSDLIGTELSTCTKGNSGTAYRLAFSAHALQLIKVQIRIARLKAV